MVNQPKRRSLSERLLKTKASVYSFLSGALLAISVNLYTGIFCSDLLPLRWKQVLAATVLTALSALLWALLAWKLEEVQDAFASSRSGVVGSEEEAWDLLIKHRRTGLLTLFSSATLVAVGGLVVVPFGIKVPVVTETASPTTITNAMVYDSTHSAKPAIGEPTVPGFDQVTNNATLRRENPNLAPSQTNSTGDVED